MIRISSIAKDETEMLYVIDVLRDNLAGYTDVCAAEMRNSDNNKELQR